ncbi:MAG: hypothetical protein II061_08720, partial [Bacteroidaceae bacterium]|nr:hypothetical protein [Bacteroidaceae bacterium]
MKLARSAVKPKFPIFPLLELKNSKTLKKPIKLKKRNEKDNSHTPCGSPNECIRTEVCTFQ